LPLLSSRYQQSPSAVTSYFQFSSAKLALRMSLQNSWALRIGLFAAPLLISGGFFGGAPRTAGGTTTPLIKLIPLGAIVLGLSTIGVGVSLLI